MQANQFMQLAFFFFLVRFATLVSEVDCAFTFSISLLAFRSVRVDTADNLRSYGWLNNKNM